MAGRKEFLIKPRGHIILTAVLSGYFYYLSRSWEIFWGSLFSGIFLDIDHVWDYFIQRSFTFRLPTMYAWFLNEEFKYLYIFLHSIELVVVSWVLIHFFNPGLFWIALALGMTQHLLLDIVSNREIILFRGYFFTFRLIKGFKRENIHKSYSPP